MFRTPQVDDLNVVNQVRLVSPERLHDELPLSEAAKKNVLAGRDAIKRILDRADPRLFVVVGPCSIHDPQAALDYGRRLAALAKEIADTMFLVMRVYFEKPRTTVGWKGLVNDPDLDDSFHIEKGLRIARRLLLDLNELGLPCGTEALDPITPQYLADLVSWSAIGARTTESQTHREMASGLSMPVGIKNGTDGSIQVAVNALKSVKTPHHFLGINQDGKISKFSTRGNLYAHIVLRGGEGNPNYDAANIKKCEKVLVTNGLRTQIIVDCSHANSNKDYKKQEMVLKDCLTQISKGNKSIVGFMIESNLDEGSQKIPEDLSQLKYGVSITDPCVGWDTTEKMLVQIQKTLKTITRK